MSIGSVTKIGWFLIGVGTGAFGATVLLRKELEKPVGDIEPYIPLEDRENGDDDLEDYSKDDSDRNSSDNVCQKSDKVCETDISKQRENGRRGSSRHNHREEEHTEFSSNNNEVLNYYRSYNEYDQRPQSGSEQDKRRREFEEYRGEANKKGVRYSRMYQDKIVEKALHVENSHRGSRNSYDIVKEPNTSDNDLYSDEDGPSDDDYEVSPVYESDIHDEFTLERVEENIEIFLDDNPQDFITTIFYEGDKTLCDDGEQIIPNPEEVVGVVALSRLIEGGPGAENGVIFVHNLKTSLNYEIVLDCGSYQDTVIGQFESHLNGDGGRGGYSR